MNSTAALHAVTDDPIDRPRAMRAVADLLTALGYDATDEHLIDTPRRVVDALIDMTASEPFVMTTFANDCRSVDFRVKRRLYWTPRSSTAIA